MDVGKGAGEGKGNKRGDMREIREGGWEETECIMYGDKVGQRTSLTNKIIQTTWALLGFELNKISRVNRKVVLHPATVQISSSVLSAPFEARQGVMGVT